MVGIPAFPVIGDAEGFSVYLVWRYEEILVWLVVVTLIFAMISNPLFLPLFLFVPPLVLPEVNSIALIFH